MNLILLIAFCVNAALSAFVGLGGGTLYLVLLDLFRVDYRAIPFIALSCNIGVSAVSALLRLWRGERENPTFLISLIIPSLLGTYLGAQFVFAEQQFRILLSTAVLCVLLFSLLSRKSRSNRLSNLAWRTKTLILVAVSFGIGLLSGMIGIGGGIILGPILYIFGMSYMHIPLITALYIAINSSMGLASQALKYYRIHNNLNSIVELGLPYWPLLLVCIASCILSLLLKQRCRHETVIKNTVICIIIILAVVNCIRAFAAV